MVWSLEEFANIDLSSTSSTMARKQRNPHKTQAVELPEECICLPLSSEFDRVNFTLEGLRQTSPPSLLELPGLGEATVRVVPYGDCWLQMGKHWLRIHVIPRDTAYTPQLEDSGPDLSTLTDTRISFTFFLDGHTSVVTDDWRSLLC